MPILGKNQYNRERFAKFNDYIRQSYENDTPQDYEIVIDGFKAVKRTSNPDAFDNYLDFIFDESKIMELVFFVGDSNNNNKYIFGFKEDYLEGNGLSGFEINNQINDKINKFKKNWEHSLVVEENKKLKEQIEELETELDLLEKEKQEMIESQSPLQGVLGEFGSSLVESFIRRNPKVLDAIPGGASLAGLMVEGNVKPNVEPEPEVTFKKSGSAHSLTEEEKSAISFVEQLKARFTKLEFDKILEILEKLAGDKSFIEKVIIHLNS